jgi:tetratricopeptide (TPR) repeat protein
LWFCAVSPLGGQLASGPSLPAWTKLSAPRFDLYSDASPERTQQVARHLQMLEDAYAALDAVHSSSPVSGQINARTQVLFFANQAGYLPLQIASQAPAFFQYGRGRDVVVAHDLGELALEVLAHEYFHVYAHRQGIILPEWLEEGLAEYYSTLRVEDDRAIVGLPLHRADSQYREIWSVRELFPITEADVSRMTPAAKERFYRRSWLLTHLLRSTVPWRDGFPRLLERIQQASTEAALAEVYGPAIDRLDSLIYSYRPQPEASPAWTVSRRQAREPESQGAGIRFQPVDLAPWEVPLLQADVFAILGRQDVAATAYERLSREFPAVPEILEAQGQLALERFDLKAAEAFFEEAAKRSSSSAEVYHRLATLRCGMQSEEAGCLDWIDRALELSAAGSRHPVGREALLYAVDFALNVQDFPRALRYLARLQPQTDQDRFQAAIKTAYAQYQLEEFDAARATLAAAEALPQEGRQRKEIADLRRAIDQREEFVIQKRLFGEGATSQAPESDAASRQKALLKALDAFARQPRAVLETGTLREIVCDATRIVLLADTPSGRIRLDVINPMDLMVLRGAARLRELDLVCGPRKEPAQFGYILRGEGTETRGDLRILRFLDATSSQP